MCLLHSSDKKRLNILTDLETWGDILSNDFQNILNEVMFSLVLIYFYWIHMNSTNLLLSLKK